MYWEGRRRRPIEIKTIICLKQLKKTTTSQSQTVWFFDRDLNQEPTEHKSKASQLS